MLCLLLAAALTAVLSGCGRGGDEEKSQSPTLPPAKTGMKAPDGDRAVRKPGDYTIYIPGRNELQASGTVHLEEASLQDSAETLARITLELFNRERTGEEGARLLSLYQDGTGREANIEISGGICTVNMGRSVLQLNYSERYKLSIALATTLCALDEIDGVNVLAAGQSMTLDVAGTLSMGTLTAHIGEDLQVLWEQMEGKRTPLGDDGRKTPVSALATIYYPLTEGRGIGCKSRMMHFEGQTPDQMAAALLTAMNDEFMQKYGNEDMPGLEEYLLHAPITSEPNDGGKVITIDFREDIQDMLDAWNTDQPCLIAAITCTLTTFIPGVSAVKMRIVENPVTDISSERFHVEQNPTGMVSREKAEEFLMGSTTVFFARNGKLTAYDIPVKRDGADSPRTLLKALMEGPDGQARKEGMKSVMPEGVTEEDVIGIAAEGDTLLVNMSPQMMEAIRDSGPENEELICYSMVNTLCLNTGMKRVCFFFGEKQAENIAGEIYWSGEFMYNPGK